MINIKEVNMLINNFKKGLATKTELCIYANTNNLSKKAKNKLEKFILAYQNFGIIE